MKSIQLYGSRKKLLMALWAIAGCFFVALNAFAFVSIFENPIPDPSREVKTARIKYSQFDAQTENLKDIIDEDAWDIFKNRFGRIVKNVYAHTVSQQTIESDLSAYEAAALPELSGILRIVTDGRETVYLAVLNGKPRVEKEDVDGFGIEKISEEKVILKRNGREWIINAPNVKYSVTHGR